MSAFTLQFTFPVQDGYAIITEPLESSLHDLAQSLSWHLSENERPNFVATVVQESRKILPQLQDADTPVEPPTVQEKKACLDLISTRISEASIAAIPATELEGFVNLYVVLVGNDSEALSTQIPLFVQKIQSVSGLQHLLHILPTSISAQTRLAICEKLVSLVAGEQRQSIILEAVKYLSDGSHETVQRIANWLLAKNDVENVLLLLQTCSSDDAALERLHLRLTLSTPTTFVFSTAAAAPETALVEYVVGAVSTMDDSLLDGAQPVLTKEGIEAKRTSLALAKAFSTRIGHKVAYSTIADTVLKLAAGTQDDIDEAVEGAVINAIKANLIQARLSQPIRSVTVISSAYHTLLPSLPEAATGTTKADGEKEQWAIIQKRLQGLKTNLASLTSGLDSSVGSSSSSARPSTEAVAQNLHDRAGDLIGPGKAVEVA